MLQKALHGLFVFLGKKCYFQIRLIDLQEDVAAFSMATLSGYQNRSHL